jgi:hypothetical protein
MSLPEREGADVDPVCELFGEGIRRMFRFKHPYRASWFVENWFDHNFNVPEHMETRFVKLQRPEMAMKTTNSIP